MQIARQLKTGWRRSPCPRLCPRTCTTHSLGRLTSQLASGRQYSLVLASDDEREDTTPHSLLFQVSVCQHIMFSCCCCSQTRSICHAGKLIWRINWMRFCCTHSVRNRRCFCFFFLYFSFFAVSSLCSSGEGERETENRNSPVSEKRWCCCCC